MSLTPTEKDALQSAIVAMSRTDSILRGRAAALETAVFSILAVITLRDSGFDALLDQVLETLDAANRASPDDGEVERRHYDLQMGEVRGVIEMSRSRRKAAAMALVNRVGGI